MPKSFNARRGVRRRELLRFWPHRVRAAWLSYCAVALSLLWLGCSGESLPTVVLAESEHFVYYARAGEKTVCPDISSALEEHFHLLAAVVPFPWPAGQRVEYFKFADDEDRRANSACDEAVACSRGASVQTAIPFHQHELIHAYLSAAGFPPWILIEGAAVALACQGAIHPRPKLSWREAMKLDRSGARSGELYGAGGWLVGHLLRRFPAMQFVQLYSSVPHEADADELSRRFEVIYQRPLEEVWAEMIAEPSRPVLCPWECSRPAMAMDGETPLASAAVCGLQQVGTLKLAESSNVLLELVGDGSSGLQGCGDGSVLPVRFIGGAREAFGAYQLSAGTYFVSGPGALGRLTGLVAPPGTYVVEQCSAGMPKPPWFDKPASVHVFAARGQPVYVDLSQQQSRTISAYAEDPLSICDQCGVSASCGAPAKSVIQLRAGESYIRIDGSGADDSELRTAVISARGSGSGM